MTLLPERHYRKVKQDARVFGSERLHHCCEGGRMSGGGWKEPRREGDQKHTNQNGRKEVYMKAGSQDVTQERDI